MPDKTVWEQADEYRRLQDARDSAVANDLATNLPGLYQRLEKLYPLIILQLIHKRELGEPLTPSEVAQQQQFLQLERQATLLLTKYGQYVDEEVRAEVGLAIESAQERAQRLTYLSYHDTEPFDGATAAVMTGWNQLDDRTVEALSARTSGGTPFQQLAGLTPQTIDAMKTVLLTGAALGHNQERMARAMQRELAVPLARAMTIARTEVHTAAREATRLTYEANADIVGGWIWRCSRTSRTCGLCWAMDGKEFDTSVKHFTHVNCRCTMVPKTHSWAELGFHGIPEPKQPPSGEDAFERLSDEDKKRVLGPGKYRLYKDGKIVLEDLIGEGTDPRYGGYRYERSLKDVFHPAPKLLPDTPPHDPPPPKPVVKPKPKEPVGFEIDENVSAGSNYIRYRRETGDKSLSFEQFKQKYGLFEDKSPPINPIKKVPPPTVKKTFEPGDDESAHESYLRYQRVTGDKALSYKAFLSRYGLFDDSAPPPPPKKPTAPKPTAPAPAPKPASVRNTTLEAQAKSARDAIIRHERDTVIPENRPWVERERLRAQKVEEQRRMLYASPHKAVPMTPVFSDRLEHHDGRYENGVAAFRRLVSPTAMPNVEVRIRSDAEGIHDRGRSYSSHGHVYMDNYVREPTVVHELGHVLEWHNRTALAASQAFLARRTSGEDIRQLGGAYRSDERTRRDAFVSPYIGKQYLEATEVMSMGLEYFYSNPAMLAARDEDMFIHVYLNARNPAAALAYQHYLT